MPRVLALSWLPSFVGCAWPWPDTVSPSLSLPLSRIFALAELSSPEDRAPSEFQTLSTPAQIPGYSFCQDILNDRETEKKQNSTRCSESLFVKFPFLWSLLFIFYKIESLIGVVFPEGIACQWLSKQLPFRSPKLGSHGWLRWLSILVMISGSWD